MVELATFLEPAWSIRERQREFRGWLGVGSQKLKSEPARSLWFTENPEPRGVGVFAISGPE